MHGMGFFVLVLQMVALSVHALPAPADQRSEAKPYESSYEGGPHGTPWSDKDYITAAHKRIAQVKLIGCAADDHISGVSFGFRDNTAPGLAVTATSEHVGKKSSQTPKELNLAADEYSTKVTTRLFQEQVHFFYYSLHTRIGHIEIETSRQQKLQCGKYLLTDPVKVHEVTDGAVLYFSGRAGDALDGLQAHWIPKDEF